MPLHAMLLSSALVAAALDGAAAPQTNHHMILAAPAAPVEVDDPWALSGPILDLDLIGTGIVALCGGLLWFFGPAERAQRRRSAPTVRRYGVPYRDAPHAPARTRRLQP